MIRARTDEYRELARDLKALDRPVQRALRGELREIARPAGDRAIEHLADAMPERGGLADLIRQRGRVSVSASSASVRIILTNRKVQMDAYESGHFRHPLFGLRRDGRTVGAKSRRIRSWYGQDVPAGEAWESMESEAPAMADRVLDATTRAVARGIGAT